MWKMKNLKLKISNKINYIKKYYNLILIPLLLLVLIDNLWFYKSTIFPLIITMLSIISPIKNKYKNTWVEYAYRGYFVVICLLLAYMVYNNVYFLN